MIYLLYFAPFFIIAVGYVYFSGKEGREEKQMRKKKYQSDRESDWYFFIEKTTLSLTKRKSVHILCI